MTGISAAPALRALRIATIVLVALALVAGMLLPVYTDEIGWRFQERAGLDGVDKLYSESCGLHTLRRPPAFMMPVRWYGAFFNTAFADPFWVRVSGGPRSSRPRGCAGSMPIVRRAGCWSTS